MKQTDLRQTGVIKALCNDNKERLIPLFSEDVMYEAYMLLSEQKIKRVLELYRYNTTNEIMYNLKEEGITRGLLESIGTYKKGRVTVFK